MPNNELFCVKYYYNDSEPYAGYVTSYSRYGANNNFVHKKEIDISSGEPQDMPAYLVVCGLMCTDNGYDAMHPLDALEAWKAIYEHCTENQPEGRYPECRPGELKVGRTLIRVCTMHWPRADIEGTPKNNRHSYPV